MNEFPPAYDHSLVDIYQNTLTDQTFTVSAEASSGLYYGAVNIADFQGRLDNWQLKIENNDETLNILAEDLIEHWDLEGSQADYFTEGFIASYTLLSYHSEMAEAGGVPLPVVEEDVYVWYKNKLAQFAQADDYGDYMVYSIVDNNSLMYDALNDYINIYAGMNVKDKKAFMLGAVSVYDILYMQGKINDLTHDVLDRSRDLKVGLSPSMLARMIDKLSTTE